MKAMGLVVARKDYCRKIAVTFIASLPRRRGLFVSQKTEADPSKNLEGAASAVVAVLSFSTAFHSNKSHFCDVQP
jgi:hypothetical protein